LPIATNPAALDTKGVPCAGICSPASSQPPCSPSLAIAAPASATSTITVYDHQSHFRSSSTGFTFNGTLHADGRHGPIVGSAKVSCTFGSGKDVTCTATATFSGADGNGQIFVAGTFNKNKNHFFLPITGGNGDFTGATGQVERTGLGGNLELLEFHLK
jgi:hypothetical protein